MEPSGYSRRRRWDMIRSAHRQHSRSNLSSFFFSSSLDDSFLSFLLSSFLPFSHSSYLLVKKEKKNGRAPSLTLWLLGSLPLWRRSRNESYLQSIIQPVITEKSIALPKVCHIPFFFDLPAQRNAIRENISLGGSSSRYLLWDDPLIFPPQKVFLFSL